jgi:DHA3 family tetracycline resistance protein-like MFS transporter
LNKIPPYRLYLLLEASASLIFSVIFTVNMVYQVETAGLNALQLVLVGTSLETSVFLFEIPTGIVADVYSRRLSIIIGYFLIGVGIVLEGVIPVFWAIALGSVIWGLGYTFTSGATQAWLSDEIGEAEAGNAFLRGGQAGMLGSLVGIVISVSLGSVRLNLPVVIGGGLFMLLSLFLIVFMGEEGFKPTPSDERDTWRDMVQTFRGGLNMVRIRPALATILAIGLFYGLYSEGYDRLWTKHLLENFSLPGLGSLQPVVWFGIINVVGMLFSIVGVELARRRVNTDSHNAIAYSLMALNALLIISLFTLARTGFFWLALASIWAVGVARSVSGPIYQAWVNRRLDSRVRATVLSMSGQVDAIGQISGGPVLGMIGTRVSVRAAITTSSFILTPVLALFAYSLRKGDRSLEEIPAMD